MEDLDKQMQSLMAMAGGSNFEAPAEVRVFAKRVRNLWGALLAEGMPPMEASQLMCIPLMVHLDGGGSSEDGA